MTLAVERWWGMKPGELATYPSHIRAKLLADYRIELDPEGPNPRASGSWRKRR